MLSTLYSFIFGSQKESFSPEENEVFLVSKPHKQKAESIREQLLKKDAKNNLETIERECIRYVVEELEPEEKIEFLEEFAFVPTSTMSYVIIQWAYDTHITLHWSVFMTETNMKTKANSAIFLLSKNRLADVTKKRRCLEYLCDISYSLMQGNEREIIEKASEVLLANCGELSPEERRAKLVGVYMLKYSRGANKNSHSNKE
jgi:hypothetical protein